MTKLIPHNYTMSFSDKLELLLVNHGIQSTAGSDVERGGRAVDGEGGSSDDGEGDSSDDGEGGSSDDGEGDSSDDGEGGSSDDGEGDSSDDGEGGSSDDGDGINELVLVNHGMQSTARTGNSSNEVNNNKSRGSSNPKRKRVVESDSD